jgi:hypothetical protein
MEPWILLLTHSNNQKKYLIAAVRVQQWDDLPIKQTKE